MSKKAKVERERRSSIKFTQPTLTQQHFKDAVNVNNIVQRYAQTGIDPYEARKSRMRYAETPSKTFEEVMFHTAEVKSAFYDLPPEDREAYGNDPQRWIADLEYQDSTPQTNVEDTASEAVSASDSEATQNRPENDDLNIT